MKVLLVQPALEPDRKWGQHPLQTMFRPAPITLPTIAACTPPGHDVRIVDDAFEKIPFDDDSIDVVGITGSTPFAVRMRQIADGFRARGRATVVVGGVYATLCPDDAKVFADAVVTGDAEDTWPAILADIERGTLQPFYRSIRPPLTGRPSPRRDLLKSWRYILPTSFQFTRGCVHSCDFCSINIQYGRQVRTTPIDAVIDDIRHARRHRLRPLMFWDDNIINDRRWTLELFHRLKDLDIKWVGQSTMLIADDPELLGAAAASGCKALFFGVESFDQSSLKETRKGFNKVKTYQDKFARIHDHGISIQAGIIFGFDHDDRGVFERTVEAAVKVKIDVAAFSLLTPYPGTDIFRRMERDGRILTYDLSKYDSDNVVFRPALMTPEELQEGWHWAQHQFYSVPNIFRRTWGTGASWRINVATSIQYNWFTKARFPRGYNPARSPRGDADPPAAPGSRVRLPIVEGS
jgi:radical SAM superfamily enzyme YgiQ (UPF0313 family)